MAKSAEQKPAEQYEYVARVGGHYIDPKMGRNVRFERGEIYNGPNPEKYVGEGILEKRLKGDVPAPAGPAQPGSDDEGGAA